MTCTCPFTGLDCQEVELPPADLVVQLAPEDLVLELPTPTLVVTLSC